MTTSITLHNVTSVTEKPDGGVNKVDPRAYVSRTWIPVSQLVLSQVKEKCGAGAYERNPLELLTDLRQDFGLFAWFLKNLPAVLNNASAANFPTQLVSDINWERCNDLFKNVSSDEFPHKLKDAAKFQSSSLKHSIISSITAEAVASSTNVSPELAHLCASVRRIGLNLVAWNYPRIFNRAMTTVAEKAENLERELARFLGFSPTTLAASICLDWNASGSIKSLVIPASTESASADASYDKAMTERESRQKLETCLELGDAMARLSDPEQFPGYAKNWATVVERLQDSMGPDALNTVQQRLSTFSNTYSTPDFDFSVHLEPRLNLTTTSIIRVANRLMLGNEWIAKCSEDLQKAFQTVYAAIDKRGISTDAINLLNAQLVAAMGIERGCIYRFDEGPMLLRPILRIGAAQLGSFPQLKCGSGKDMNHPAVLATSSANPVVLIDTFAANLPIASISANFGNIRQKAVLYIEFSPKSPVALDKQLAMRHFKAVQKTLVDCLNIE